MKTGSSIGSFSLGTVLCKPPLPAQFSLSIWSPPHPPPLFSPLRCVLGNTTILAEFASEEEINRFFAQGQSMTAPPSWQTTLGSSQSRLGPSSMEGSAHPFPPSRTDPNHWNGSGLAGAPGGELHAASLWGGPNYSTSLWGSPSSSDGPRISSSSPISSFLPVDHLAGSGEAM